MNAPDRTCKVSILEQILAGISAPARTPVALELDAAYAAGRTILDYLAVNSATLEVMRKALADSGGGGTDTNFIAPIFSPRATAEDAEWFRDNASRTHSIRPAIEGESVLAGRGPADQYAVVARQLGIGFRILVAIDNNVIILDPATRGARYDNDAVLSLLFERGVRAVPGDSIITDIDKIIALVDEQSSSAATTESDSKRRLQ